MLTSLFKKQKNCRHKKITPFSTGNFCPDCGMEIEIFWLILRCECCQSKRAAHVVFNSIIPEDKHCIKCGASGYYIEKKETLEFFEFEYAVISKKAVNDDFNTKEMLQIWIESENEQTSLLLLRKRK